MAKPLCGGTGFESQEGQKISAFSASSRWAMGPYKSYVEWVLGYFVGDEATQT